MTALARQRAFAASPVSSAAESAIRREANALTFFRLWKRPVVALACVPGSGVTRLLQRRIEATFNRR